ncbi:hypothetical protein P4126_32375 [Pseudomonas aeruginosa]|nr:hypothetical protein [Pseudomonas aeruginosa]MDF5950425.1 hypothetical protein [Pseudomonas aeruginosa]
MIALKAETAFVGSGEFLLVSQPFVQQVLLDVVGEDEMNPPLKGDENADEKGDVDTKEGLESPNTNLTNNDPNTRAIMNTSPRWRSLEEISCPNRRQICCHSLFQRLNSSWQIASTKMISSQVKSTVLRK